MRKYFISFSSTFKKLNVHTQDHTDMHTRGLWKAKMREFCVWAFNTPKFILGKIIPLNTSNKTSVTHHPYQLNQHDGLMDETSDETTNNVPDNWNEEDESKTDASQLSFIQHNVTQAIAL